MIHWQVKHLRSAWYEVIEALPNAGSQLLRRLQGDPAAASTPAVAQLQAAHCAMKSADDAIYAGLPPQVRQLTFPIDNLDSLSEPASALGTAMQQCWEQSGEADQVRLEVAQAAATRSCACLACCTFIGGGPAAGEGQGCKRCAGCRTVW